MEFIRQLNPIDEHNFSITVLASPCMSAASCLSPQFEFWGQWDFFAIWLIKFVSLYLSSAFSEVILRLQHVLLHTFSASHCKAVIQ